MTVRVSRFEIYMENSSRDLKSKVFFFFFLMIRILSKTWAYFKIFTENYKSEPIRHQFIKRDRHVWSSLQVKKSTLTLEHQIVFRFVGKS